MVESIKFEESIALGLLSVFMRNETYFCRLDLFEMRFDRLCCGSEGEVA